MPTKLFQNKNLQLFISDVGKDVFEVFLVFYLMLLLVNQVKQNFVSDFLNLNHILFIAATAGIISLWKIDLKITKRDYIFILAIALITSITIFYKTLYFGFLKAFILSFSSFVSTVLILVFLLKK